MLRDFLLWSHAGQTPPDNDDWRIWLFMGGRGACKTRAGAEWVRQRVMEEGARRIALVAPTLNDAREVMIEGPSGLAHIGPEDERPLFFSSRRRLEWPNGAVGYVFSAEDPDSLRGPQFDTAWCDEIGAWAKDEATWDMLMFGLRLGDNPRVAATTTPRPSKLVKRLYQDPKVALTRGSTSDNLDFLGEGFVEAVKDAYGGTRMGRQELDGEMIEDREGALWARKTIEAGRCAIDPEALVRVVVGVDPPASKGKDADACGIVAAGLLSDGRAVVLSDDSAQGLAPLDWATRVAVLARKWGAAEIVAEANQGGEMVREVLTLAGANTPIRLVHARFSKAMRAGPVAALYAQGKVCHAGAFPELEDEMCAFGAKGFSASPDRLDAMVWAITALLLENRGCGARVRVL